MIIGTPANVLTWPVNVSTATLAAYRTLAAATRIPANSVGRAGAPLKLMIPFMPWSNMCQRRFLDVPCLRARQAYLMPTGRMPQSKVIERIQKRKRSSDGESRIDEDTFQSKASAPDEVAGTRHGGSRAAAFMAHQTSDAPV